MNPLLGCVVAALAALAAASDVYTTGNWITYPGSSVNFAGSAITGTVELSEPEGGGTKVTGTLSNMPTATSGGIHVHEGFDESDKDTIGGHYFAGLQTDPWNDVTYSTSDGDTTIDADVAGISLDKTLGRVMVIHDQSGARVAASTIIPKAPTDTMIYSAMLSPYPKYTHLVATMGNYPGSSQGVTGTVWLTEKSGGGLTVTYNLAGLVSSDTEGGIHVHAGYGKDVCNDVANPLGHYWLEGEDPWTTNYVKAAGETTAVGSVDVADSGYLLGGNEYHAMVIHQADGGRIGCGVLHSVGEATIGNYPGASSSGISGTVWVAQGGKTDEPDHLALSYELAGLPANEQMGGLHFHTGKTCDTAADVGGHFWTPESDPDPWDNFNTTWMKAADTTEASGMFFVASGYNLAENGDHAIVIHAADGSRIGCGVFKYYPAVQGYVTLTENPLTGALTMMGNVAGVMYQESEIGAVRVHEGTSCADITGTNSPGGHLKNTDNRDPWDGSATFSVGKPVTKPPGGVDYGAATRMSGQATVDVAASGDMQTLSNANGKTVVVHSAESGGHRVACGKIQSMQGTSSPSQTTDGAMRSAWGTLPLFFVSVWAFHA